MNYSGVAKEAEPKGRVVKHDRGFTITLFPAHEQEVIKRRRWLCVGEEVRRAGQDHSDGLHRVGPQAKPVAASKARRRSPQGHGDEQDIA